MMTWNGNIDHNTSYKWQKHIKMILKMKTKMITSTKFFHIYWQSFGHFCDNFNNIFVHNSFCFAIILCYHFCILSFLAWQLLCWLLFRVIFFLCYNFVVTLVSSFVDLIIFVVISYYYFCFQFIWQFWMLSCVIISPLFIIVEDLIQSPNSGGCFLWLLVSDIAITKVKLLQVPLPQNFPSAWRWPNNAKEPL